MAGKTLPFSHCLTTLSHHLAPFPSRISTAAGIFAYVIMKESVATDHEQLRKEMSDMVSARIGKFAKPEAIVVGFWGREGNLFCFHIFIFQLLIQVQSFSVFS